MFDSGIRTGADIFEPLALGAGAVILGRPYCYGLAAGEKEGVRSVIWNYRADFDLTMGLAGWPGACDRHGYRTVGSPLPPVGRGRGTTECQ